MFTVITPMPVKKRWRKVVYPERVEMADKYYFLQKLPVLKGNPDWKGLVSSEKLLLPIDFKAPDNILLFGGYDWQLALTAEKLKKQLQRERCDLIFLDRKGIHGGYIMRLAEYARSSAVFTENTAYYYNHQKEIYRNTGCYVQINAMAGVSEGYAFFTDEAECSFFKEGFKSISTNSLCDEDIIIPAGYDRFIPQKVRRCDFAEALYTACGIGHIGDYIKPPKTTCNFKRIEV